MRFWDNLFNLAKYGSVLSQVAVLAEKDSNYVMENCSISGWGRTTVEVLNQPAESNDINRLY